MGEGSFGVALEAAGETEEAEERGCVADALDDEGDYSSGKRWRKVCHGDKVELEIQGRCVWREQDGAPNDGRQRVLSGDVGVASPLILLLTLLPFPSYPTPQRTSLRGPLSLDPASVSI